MADASSVIRVSIIGDAKNLQKTLGTAERSVGGITKKVGFAVGALGALGATAVAFDFLKDSSEEADRLADAADRLNFQLGPDFAKRVEGVAANFTTIGLSTQDVTELSANFADIATSLGIADPLIADFAPNVAATAQAMALLGNGDVAGNVDLIAKAAGGSVKAAKELGVKLIDNATPAQQLVNIMSQLKPQLDKAVGSAGDLEQKQSELQAQIETLQGQVGGPLNDAMVGILYVLTNIIADVPRLVKEMQDVAAAAGEVLSPLARVRDIIDDIVNGDHTVRFTVVAPGGRAPRGSPGSGSGGGGGGSDRSISDAARRQQERNGLGT